MKIEKAELWIRCEEPLRFPDGRALRGFFGNLYRNRPEFHHHHGGQLIYRHPLIQYKILEECALIIGLKEGAYLLKAVPKLDCLILHHQDFAVLEQDLRTTALWYGLTSDTICYRLVTAWVGLNERNHAEYLRIRHNRELVSNLLRKVLIGNILSMSKSLRYVAKRRIEACPHFEESGRVEIKQGVEMIAFGGEFEVNFNIPDLWGIGKSSARGYGTLIKG